MIHRSPIHRSEAEKLAQIYKDKQFVHEGTVYELDIVQSKESTRLARMRPKDAIQRLVGTAATHHIEVNSDTCFTVAQHASQNETKAMMAAEPTPESFDGSKVDLDKADEVGQMASVEADEDVTPAPKKAVKPKDPVAKPKPAVKKPVVKKKK